MKILIDNGHGQNTAGKRSPDGQYLEYAHARVIATEIVKRLVAKGYDAIRLTPEMADIPLPTRVARANDWCQRLGKDNVLLVSIHSNAASDGKWTSARGWCVYTSPGQTRADLLATCIYQAAQKHLRGYMDTFSAEDKARGQKPFRIDPSDGDPDFEAPFFILKYSRCPAVLTENLFHDNHDDVAFLKSPQGVDAIVDTHVDGIIDYINRNK